MREAVRERRARASGAQVDGEAAVRAKIAAMGVADRRLAERFHRIVRTIAPSLTPRTWYGMPAYSKGDDVLCWFTPAEKFKSRYATIGFSDAARLDEGHLWPCSFALTELGGAEEARITALLKKALS
jgi:uncharacterized protein YdhG (YjbR/CyaY superfamily)